MSSERTQSINEFDPRSAEERGNEWIVAWQAPDDGPPTEVDCPRCKCFLGTMGIYGESSFLCYECQALYRAKGDENGNVNLKEMGRQVIFGGALADGGSVLGNILRGKPPTGFWLRGSDFWIILVVEAFLVLMLLLAL